MFDRPFMRVSFLSFFFLFVFLAGFIPRLHSDFLDVSDVRNFYFHSLLCG